jgi:hypothetical protein
MAKKKSQRESDDEFGRGEEQSHSLYVMRGWNALAEEDKTNENLDRLMSEADEIRRKNWEERLGTKGINRNLSVQMGNPGTDARVSSENDDNPGIRCGKGDCGERFFTFGERDAHHTEAHPAE